MQISRNVTDRKMVRCAAKTVSLSTALSYHGEYWGNYNISEIMFEILSREKSTLLFLCFKVPVLNRFLGAV